MSRKRGSFKRKVEAIIDSRWPGRWFQNNINNDFTEEGNNKLTHTSGDIVNVNTGETINMALLGILFKKDNSVMGMWKGPYNNVPTTVVVPWNAPNLQDQTAYYGVIGYLNSFFNDRKLTAFLASYNFKMFPNVDKEKLAPTTREITKNCNEDHLIDALASPIETYTQFGTTTYSASPPSTGTGLVPADDEGYFAQLGQADQTGPSPVMLSQGQSLAQNSETLIPLFNISEQQQANYKAYSGWRFKFLYPNSRAVNTGKDHFLQQEQFFPHNPNQWMNRALLYGSAVRTPQVPWFAPNFVPAYIQGAGSSITTECVKPGTETNEEFSMEGAALSTLITLANAGTVNSTAVWPLGIDKPDGPFLANNLFNNPDANSGQLNTEQENPPYTYLGSPYSESNQDWASQANTYNVKLATAMKLLFTPPKYLQSSISTTTVEDPTGQNIVNRTYVDQAGYNDVDCDSYSGWDGCPYTLYQKQPQQRGWDGNPATKSMCETYATKTLQPPNEEATVDTANKYFNMGSTTMIPENSFFAMRGTAVDSNIGTLPEYVPGCNRNALYLGFCPPLPRKYNHVDILTNSWRATVSSENYHPQAATLEQDPGNTAIFKEYKGAGGTSVYPPNLFTHRYERQNLCYEMKQNDWRGGSKVNMKECSMKFKLVLPARKYSNNYPLSSIYGSKSSGDGVNTTLCDNNNIWGAVIPGQIKLITTPVKVCFRIIMYRNARNGTLIDPKTEAIQPLTLKDYQDKIELRHYKVYADKLVWWKRGCKVSLETKIANSVIYKDPNNITDGEPETHWAPAANITNVYYPRSIKHFKFYRKNRRLTFLNEHFCYPAGIDFVFLRIAVWKFNLNGDVISTRLKYINGSGSLVNVKEKDILGDFRQRFWSTHYWKSSV